MCFLFCAVWIQAVYMDIATIQIQIDTIYKLPLESLYYFIDAIQNFYTACALYIM